MTFPKICMTFPKKRIRARIRRYERSLRQEQKRFGHIGDGSGKRYLLGPLYLLMGDTKGALQSYTWFDQIFPDDSDDPLHLLCWTLVLYRMGAWNQAEAKLRQTMLSNLYLVPHVLGIEHRCPRDVASLQSDSQELSGLHSGVDLCALGATSEAMGRSRVSQ